MKLSEAKKKCEAIEYALQDLKSLMREAADAGLEVELVNAEPFTFLSKPGTYPDFNLLVRVDPENIEEG